MGGVSESLGKELRFPLSSQKNSLYEAMFCDISLLCSKQMVVVISGGLAGWVGSAREPRQHLRHLDRKPLSLYRQRLGISLRMFQGLAGGGGSLSTWWLLSIQKSAPSVRLCKVEEKKMTFYSSLFQKVPLRDSADQKTPLGFVDASLFHPIGLSLRSPLSWVHNFLFQLHCSKIEASEAAPCSPEGRGAAFSGRLWGEGHFMALKVHCDINLEGGVWISLFRKQCPRGQTVSLGFEHSCL